MCEEPLCTIPAIRDKGTTATKGCVLFHHHTDLGTAEPLWSPRLYHHVELPTKS